MKVAQDSESDLLQPAEIESELVSKGLNDHLLLYRPQTRSTNIDVLQHYQHTGQLSIAICEQQLAGKGRRGRQWVSPFAQNIYCTVGIIKSLPPSHLGLLSIISGIALCRAIASCGIEAVQLKWPNDLVFANGHLKQKLGGILIESKPVANGYFLAIGFGLNVHMTRHELDAIPQAATSLSLISKKQLKRQTLLLAAIESVIDAIDLFDGSNIQSLVDQFSRHDAYSDQQICVLNVDEEIHGINVGINHSGQLLLKTEQGLLAFSAAEISLRAIS